MPCGVYLGYSKSRAARSRSDSAGACTLRKCRRVMTRAGDARPITIPFGTVAVLTRWLQGAHTAFRNRRPFIGGLFWAEYNEELFEFSRKLENASFRGDERTDTVTLWTVRRTEACAAYGYLKVTWSAWPCADSPVGNRLAFSALHLALILHKVLDRTRGQPRRTPAQARRLLDGYRRTPSSERCKFSGARIREARQQVVASEILELIIADYREYDGAIPPGSVGDDLLRLMRERYLDFAEDREVFVEYDMQDCIDAAIEQLAPEIATVREIRGLRR